MDIADLYKQLILDHSKNPRNLGNILNGTHKAEGYNPLCGDHFWVYALIDDDSINSITFEGDGCAISKASASLMTDALKETSPEKAKAITDQFLAMIKGDSHQAPTQPLEALKSVRDFPTRIKCASLPWHTFLAALQNQTRKVVTE